METVEDDEKEGSNDEGTEHLTTSKHDDKFTHSIISVILSANQDKKIEDDDVRGDNTECMELITMTHHNDISIFCSGNSRY